MAILEAFSKDQTKCSTQLTWERGSNEPYPIHPTFVRYYYVALVDMQLFGKVNSSYGPECILSTKSQ